MASVADAKNSLEQSSFVNRVIEMMAKVVRGDGTEEQWKELSTSTDERRVEKARFALGADDGAYLRANVMPLQTTLPDCGDHRTFMEGLGPEIRAATQVGVLKALQEKLKETIKADEKELFGQTLLVGFLASVAVSIKVFPNGDGYDQFNAILDQKFNDVDEEDEEDAAYKSNEEIKNSVGNFLNVLKAVQQPDNMADGLKDTDVLDATGRVLEYILSKHPGFQKILENERTDLESSSMLIRERYDASIQSLIDLSPNDRKAAVEKTLTFVRRASGTIDSNREYLRNVQEELAKMKGKGMMDSNTASRTKRLAVWNDALRESCISQDRLYAFVRQLSGTISENVDAVCQIDEGLLVRQQREARESRQRLVAQAAQEQMTLVRNVFSAVIRDSGLSLGIESLKDKDAQLKVVSSTLRKQASELASGSAGEAGGYFSNSVRLENLLASGTGEITLQELFEKLNAVGSAIRKAALGSEMDEYDESATASLDFLSAPRNSLLLRYKPEALSAVRQAFQLFQREMQHQGNRMTRRISAFELMEGNDDDLCTAFATFSAHVLVHSRMYSSGTAMYIGAWPAAANAQQLKISLQRLVTCAKEYCWHTNRPSFGSGDGRASYFSGHRAKYLM